MDKYQDMTLEQLAAEFDKVKAELAALASEPKTPATAEKATELRASLTDIKAAGESIRTLSVDTDLEFAPKEEEKEPEAEVQSEAKTDGETDKVDAEVTRVDVHDGVGVGQVADADGNGVDLQAAAEKGEADAKVAAKGVAGVAAANAGKTPDVPSWRTKNVAVITASAGLDSYAAGQQMTSGLDDVAAAAIERVKSFPGWEMPTGQMLEFAQQGVPQLQKFGTAMIDLGFPSDLIIDEGRMSPQQMDEILTRAADESTLPGGSLTAAAGWCAPSETQYDIAHDATAEGMLSHPEVGVRRGGVRWPVSPQFSDFYANPGFKYTEAQVIAGVTKPCVTITCPSFDEARLSVEGLCIKVDILTNVGYPEVVRNFTDGTMIAHQHWMNATKIAAMATIAGTATDYTSAGLGSSVDDSLEALVGRADRLRQKYRLSLSATMEVVVPFWTKEMFKSDLRRRTMQIAPVTDEQLNALFRAAKMNVQFVYDWQDLPLADVGGTAGFNELTQYPVDYTALMYPAGTFIFGTQPVITVSTVYDAASLAANQFTGLFTEQGWFVAKKKLEAVQLKMPVCNAGRRGALDITCS